MVILLGLGIGFIPAGITLVVASRVYRKRMRDPDLVLWSGVIAMILAAVLLTIAFLWR